MRWNEFFTLYLILNYRCNLNCIVNRCFKEAGGEAEAEEEVRGEGEVEEEETAGEIQKRVEGEVEERAEGEETGKQERE